MQLIGIELSNTYVKCIEVTKYRQKLLIKKGHLLEIKPQDNQEQLLKWFRKIGILKGYSKKSSIVVINHSQIIIRQLAIPIVSELTLQQQLEIKPEIYLPIKRGTHQIRFKRLNTIEEQNEKMLVQFVAVPNTIIYDTIHLVKQLKKRLIAINIPSESVTSLFSGQEPILGVSGQNVLIVDIGIETTQILIIESNGGHLVRFVPFGVKHMKIFAQEFFEETYQEFDKVTLIKMLYLQIDYYIVCEIERLLKFYKMRNTSFNIQRLYLISEFKFIEEVQIRDYISCVLNIEAYPIEVIKNVKSNIETIAPFLYLIGAMKAL